LRRRRKYNSISSAGLSQFAIIKGIGLSIGVGLFLVGCTDREGSAEVALLVYEAFWAWLLGLAGVTSGALPTKATAVLSASGVVIVLLSTVRSLLLHEVKKAPQGAAERTT
jgi:hypothetical protein